MQEMPPKGMCRKMFKVVSAVGALGAGWLLGPIEVSDGLILLAFLGIVGVYFHCFFFPEERAFRRFVEIGRAVGRSLRKN